MKAKKNSVQIKSSLKLIPHTASVLTGKTENNIAEVKETRILVILGSNSEAGEGLVIFSSSFQEMIL